MTRPKGVSALDTYAPLINQDLLYRLRGLGMAGTILHIGAHPDDEDAGLMAYMSRKHGVRTVYWSATRGEGGQNRIGSYKAEALGIFRTWESLDARSVDGGEIMFGPFYDFGFCKSGDEALEKWGRRVLVQEIVRAIRLTQPQIVISRWSGGPADGHGHHQAVGRVVVEAFEAASDPEQFPELDLMIWQSQKLYLSTGGDWQPGEDTQFGNRQSEYDANGFVCINTGEFDPISGRTYQELGWLAFNKYHSQAMSFVPEHGEFFYYYRLHKSYIPTPSREESFFDGTDPTLTALVAYPISGSQAMRDQLDTIKEQVQFAFEHFHVDDPLEAAYSLADGLSRLHELRANLQEEDFDATIANAMDAYLAQKISDFEDVIARCLGLHLEALTDNARLVPGDSTRLVARLWNPRRIAVDNLSFELSLPDDWKLEPEVPPAEQSHGEYVEAVYQLKIPQAAELSCPHWLRTPRSSYTYTLTDVASAGQPFDPPLVQIECTVSFGGHQIRLREPGIRKEPIPGGFRALPLAIVPPISLQPRSLRQFLRVQPEEQHLLLQVTVRNNNTSGRIGGTLTLETPTGWQVEHNHVEITLEQVGDSTALQFHLTVPPDTQPGRYALRYVVKSAARDYDVILNPVRMGPPGVPHEPDASNCVREEFVIEPAVIQVHVVDVEFTQGLRYAYVRGADEDILETLSQMDVSFDVLSDEDIDFADLSEYDAIIIGPNAYLIRDELVKNSPRFLDYVEQGGTLIVQYQGYGYQNHSFAPHWFEYNQPHDRVTWENAPISILQPEHFLMNLPNPIGKQDFENWVHDRGMYFFGKWDKQYMPILSCSDLNEAPRIGGLLVTSYGRGTYVYVGYSLFRQLPAGVTGAFRLFANLLALPVGRLLKRKEFLREVSLFSSMNDQQLETVARFMTERTEEDGVYLARSGETGSELYIIMQGEVEIIKESAAEEVLMTTFGPGVCIGEISVLVSSPRTAAMRTKGNVNLLVLKGSDFQFLIQEYPNMAYRVIQMLAQRLATVISS